MTDPIADMLTRIRNANTVGHETVEIPASKMKKAIAEILKEEGYITDFDVIEDDKQGMIKVTMKYGANKERVISGIKKISKPGLKVYAKANDVPKVLGGLGIAIISTSKGIVSDKEARKLGVGGEVICYVEAMKTYNAIRAEYDGTITAICVNSGDSVSEDDVLMKIL